jgi:copper chaperone
MTELTISVPEIHCDHCKMSIEGAVGALDGVEQTTVDIEARTVDVTFEPPASFAAIVGAIEDVGYEVPAQA